MSGCHRIPICECAANVLDGFTPFYVRFTIGLEFRRRMSGFVPISEVYR